MPSQAHIHRKNVKVGHTTATAIVVQNHGANTHTHTQHIHKPSQTPETPGFPTTNKHPHVTRERQTLLSSSLRDSLCLGIARGGTVFDGGGVGEEGEHSLNLEFVFLLCGNQWSKVTT